MNRYTDPYSGQPARQTVFFNANNKQDKPPEPWRPEGQDLLHLHAPVERDHGYSTLLTV